MKSIKLGGYMFIEERHQKILELIEKDGRVAILDMKDKFHISIESARRDLRILEEKGLLKRTHGGAITLPQVGTKPPRHRDITNMKKEPNYAEIARKATTFVHENDIIYITSGSVGFMMLDYLPRDISYTIVVNSVSLADALKYWDNIEVYVVGGKMRMHGTTSIVDSFATAFVKNLHFDTCFMTAGGYDTSFGLSNGTAETATYQCAVIENSRKKILLMPSNKIGFKAFVKVCDADVFDVLITDWDCVEVELLKMEELGVEVIVVDNPDHEGKDR
jgi:DeoR family transcriptional regulator, fructose operon transcriptional repressor